VESSIAVAEREERLMARDGGGTSEKRGDGGVGEGEVGCGLAAWLRRGRRMTDNLNNIV
jgi:hypothetical protein